jgi:hypothetical protein
VTDRDKLLALLDGWDVPYTTDSKIRGQFLIIVGGGSDSPKIDGYLGFYTMFVFDEDGAFLLMGAWE